MTNNKSGEYELGMVGLGVMGCNVLLNMSDNGYSVAGFDLDQKKVDALKEQSKGREILSTINIKEFVASIRKPRAIMMLVPAGKPVDSVIEALLPHLEKDDLIIDAGNSHFTDTDVREDNLKKKGINFFGMGVSGGEKGARHGPSMMPGGPKEAYERVRPVLEAISAKADDGKPCVTYLGPRSAGHYVKMVHNGIEYAIMQIIDETYDLMKRGLGMNNADIQTVFEAWNKEELNGYLMEITANIFKQKDDKTDNMLIDMIKPVAKQKGTGLWTSQSALQLQLPTPTIDIAVAMRDISGYVDERHEASAIYNRPIEAFKGDRDAFIKQLRDAVYAGIIIAYAQGMALMVVASDEYKYELNLEDVARIWRGGCIIRSALLPDLMAAFHTKKGLRNPLLDAGISKKIKDTQENLRKTVSQGLEIGVPVPGLITSLAYFDAYRSDILPANLTQAQRDFFGSHTYERIDEDGTFHTQWEEK